MPTLSKIFHTRIVYHIKGLHKVNEDDMELLVLFSTFFQDLVRAEHHIIAKVSTSKAALCLWHMLFSARPYAVKDHMGIYTLPTMDRSVMP